MSLADVAHWLACPPCGEPLRLVGGALLCSHGHSHDIARQGHVNLLGGPQPDNADTPAMVAARLSFLAGGHYGPIVAAVASGVGGAQRVLDVGAGPGWYLARLLEYGEERLGVAVDVSVAACRRAARAHPRAAAVVADVWRALPLLDGAVDAATCVFAPRNLPELARVLSPGGVLVVATPGPDHLAEAREEFGLLGIRADKQEALRQQAGMLFDEVGAESVRGTVSLTPAELIALVDMGPNAFHAHARPIAGMSVTLEVTVQAFRRR